MCYPHHLYTVVSCLPCQLRAVGEIVDQLQDLFMGEFVRNETVDGGLQCGGCDQMRLVAVAPGMQNLQGDFAAFLMYGFGNGAAKTSPNWRPALNCRPRQPCSNARTAKASSTVARSTICTASPAALHGKSIHLI